MSKPELNKISCLSDWDSATVSSNSSTSEEEIIQKRKTYDKVYHDILNDIFSWDSSIYEPSLLRKRRKRNPPSTKTGNTESPPQNRSKVGSKSTKSPKLSGPCQCVLCEKVFDSIQKRNSHYKGKSHNIESAELVFFVDGAALLPGTDYARRVLNGLEKFKTLAERARSEGSSKYSRCKLCTIDCLKTEDVVDHYECLHKVKVSKVESLIRLKNSDLQILVDPYNCPNCEKRFDDISRLKMHLLSHNNEMKCQFCNRNIKNRRVYKKHIREEHSDVFKYTTDKGENKQREQTETESDSEDSDGSYEDSTSSENRESTQTGKIKLLNKSRNVLSEESLRKRVDELEKIIRQRYGNIQKRGKFVNDKTPSKNAPKHVAKSNTKSMAQCKSTSDGNNASTSTDALQYDCKLCEGTFKSKQARNNHYTGTHKVENEKLLFFPDGNGLVESTLEHHLRLKPEYLKTAASNMSSRVCKLCKVELDMDDLKWHYERVHKVIQMNKVKPLIFLNHSDIKIIAEPFRCEYCPRTFDDKSRLKMHLLTHKHKGDETKCKFCKLNFNTNLYNAHVKKEHPKIYLKCNRISRENTNKYVDIKKSSRKNVTTVTRPEKYERYLKKSSSLVTKVTIGEHRRSVHKVKEKQSKTNVKKTKFKNSNVVLCDVSREVENNKTKESEDNSTSENASRRVPTSIPAIIMYLCEACNFATTSYDEAVSHSQDHILNMVNNETTLCQHCNLKFGSDYETHKQLHEIHSELDIDSFQCIFFKYNLLYTAKWMDMFNFLPKVKVMTIVEDYSVFFSTRCIRFKLPGCMNNSSAPYTLFQCITCRNYVDPYSIESHVQQQSCSVGCNSHPCEACQRPFYSDLARIQHSNTHKVPDADSKYRTILFNDQSDLTSNESLLRAANKSIPQMKNKVIAPGNIATQVEAKKQKEGIQDADKAKEYNDSCGPKKLAIVYKCQCGLCFHTLSHMYDHLENCPNESNALDNEKVKCVCGLLFDIQNYPLHCKVHRSDYTTIQVKEVILQAGDNINIAGMYKDKEFNNIYEDTNVTEHLKLGNSEDSNITRNSDNEKSIPENYVSPVHEDVTIQDVQYQEPVSNIGINSKITLTVKMKLILEEYLRNIETNGESNHVVRSEDVLKMIEALNKSNSNHEFDSNDEQKPIDSIVKNELTNDGVTNEDSTIIAESIDVHSWNMLCDSVKEEIDSQECNTSALLCSLSYQNHHPDKIDQETICKNEISCKSIEANKTYEDSKVTEDSLNIGGGSSIASQYGMREKTCEPWGTLQKEPMDGMKDENVKACEDHENERKTPDHACTFI